MRITPEVFFKQVNPATNREATAHRIVEQIEEAMEKGMPWGICTVDHDQEGTVRIQSFIGDITNRRPLEEEVIELIRQEFIQAGWTVTALHNDPDGGIEIALHGKV